MPNTFDNIAELYDLMVPWDTRLPREAPFFREFLGPPPQRVLDAGCGTGRHALLFSSFGHQVTASDESPSVLEVGERNAGSAGAAVTFIQHDLLRPFPGPGQFDRITVLGNVLAQFVTKRALGAVLRGLRQRLAPGGALLFQMVNFGGSAIRKERYSPLRHAFDGDREVLFQKFFDFLPRTVELNLLIFTREGQHWDRRIESTTLRPWTAEELQKACSSAGFGTLTLYGDYQRSAFEAQRSRDIIGLAVIPPEDCGGR